ncbi:glucokinase [Flammeovirgaceae bacterium 311]|nr:glucokinase [Flammeovirgaceae bacterium 311]
MEKEFIGIEIGGTKLQVVTGDGSGMIHERLRYAIVKENGAEGIKKQIDEALNILQSRIRPLAVGIGFGGPVNRETGKISLSFHIEGWADFDLVHWLHARVKVPVFIENDGNVAALGEAKHGAGRDYRDVFYITLGSGVGGGLVNKGRIYHGAFPGEAEIGHVRLDRLGSTMETNCSGWSVDRKIREAITGGTDSLLGQLAKDAGRAEARYLGPALEQGDSLAKQILQETGADIAFGLSHVVHLFHPEIIILGGGLSLIGEPLRAVVEAELRPYLMEAFLPGPQVVLSHLKEDAVPAGALALASQMHTQLADTADHRIADAAF